MDATWAIVGDDSLVPVLALLERCLETAFDTPGRPTSLTGRAAAEALIRAFPDHFECQAPGDGEFDVYAPPRQGFIQGTSANLAKSVSVETTVSPCSRASAAR